MSAEKPVWGFQASCRWRGTSPSSREPSELPSASVPGENSLQPVVSNKIQSSRSFLRGAGPPCRRKPSGSHLASGPPAARGLRADSLSSLSRPLRFPAISSQHFQTCLFSHVSSFGNTSLYLEGFILIPPVSPHNECSLKYFKLRPSRPRRLSASGLPVRHIFSSYLGISGSSCIIFY